MPEYTFDKSEAATAFELRIQGKGADGMSDLAKGAGGEWRYVRAVRDAREPRRVVEAQLVRSSTRLVPGDVAALMGSQSWEGARRDINDDRGGDWLYLVWRTY